MNIYVDALEVIFKGASDIAEYTGEYAPAEWDLQVEDLLEMFSMEAMPVVVKCALVLEHGEVYVMLKNGRLRVTDTSDRCLLEHRFNGDPTWAGFVAMMSLLVGRVMARL